MVFFKLHLGYEVAMMTLKGKNIFCRVIINVFNFTNKYKWTWWTVFLLWRFSFAEMVNECYAIFRRDSFIHSANCFSFVFRLYFWNIIPKSLNGKKMWSLKSFFIESSIGKWIRVSRNDFDRNVWNSWILQ